MIIKFGIKTKVSCPATGAPEIVGRCRAVDFVLRALEREKSGGKATVIRISGNGRGEESNRGIFAGRAYPGFFLLVASLMAGPALGQQADIPDAQKNPFAGDPAAVAAGRTLYEQTCQACHGGEARGDRGPALASGNFRHGSGDNDLFRTIRSGIPGTPMPAFSLLPSDNVWRIITYLRSLNTNGAAADEVVTGNAVAGEATFWGKGGCGRCHEVNARGLDIGPDLSDAGKNSATYLRGMILDPNAARPNQRRWFGPSAVSIKTRNGEEVKGIKRAEDNYTLLMTDLTGKLRRFDRKDILAETAETKSLMPDNYSQLLSPSEVQDLVAYLKSLKARDLAKTIQVDIPGGLTFARLRDAQAEPQNWLTYWGDYQGHHFSSLRQITPLNVKQPAGAVVVADAPRSTARGHAAGGGRHHVHHLHHQHVGGCVRH